VSTSETDRRFRAGAGLVLLLAALAALGGLGLGFGLRLSKSVPVRGLFVRVAGEGVFDANGTDITARACELDAPEVTIGAATGSHGAVERLAACLRQRRTLVYIVE